MEYDAGYYKAHFRNVQTVTYYFLQKSDWMAEFRIPKGAESLCLLLTPNRSMSPTSVNFPPKGTIAGARN
jgi:hypothetical protein